VNIQQDDKNGNTQNSFLTTVQKPKNNENVNTVNVQHSKTLKHIRNTYTLQWAAHPPQNCPFRLRYLELHLIHGSLGPHKSSTLNSISIGSAIFAGHYRTDRPTDGQTDRPTHHATRSVTIGRIYARTAMQPNNDNQAYSEYKHSLTSRVRRYVVTATKAVHQVQIRPIMRNYHTVPFPQVTSGSAQ